MPEASIRQNRSIFSAIGIPRLGILLLTLLLGCNRTVAPPTAEGQKAKAELKAAAEPAEPSAPAARTAALIDLDRTPAGALLEQRLSKSTSLTWLERENLAALLKEQELQTLFSPEAGARRTALGQLLKVDLLVLLRSVLDADGKEPKPLVHLVVCETRNGLRLCSQTLPVKDLQECVAEMERQVQTALRKQQEEIRVIWAVPPFVSKDLRYRFDYLKAAYARLVEQVLLAQKGTLVVELAEAEAIAQEHRLTGSKARPQRQLPLYFLGEYRNEEAGGKRQVSVGLKLKRGERILGAAEQANLAADKVPAFLLQATGDLIKTAEGVEQQKFNPEAEVVQLAARARTFLKLGSWSEALALVEASLLLKPSQAALHHEGALACSMLAQDYHGRNMHKKMVGGKFDPKKEGDPKALALAFQYYLRGLEHEEMYLKDEGKSPQPLVPGNKAPAGRAMSFEVGNTSWMLAQGRTRSKDLQEEYDQMREEEQAILLRLTRQRARDGWGDEHRYLSLALRTVPSLRERFALIGQMIRELQDLPAAKQRTFRFTDTIRENSIVGITIVQPYDSPEFQDFLKELATIPNKDAQAGVAEVRKFGLKIHADMERFKKEEENKFAKNTRSSSPDGATLAQFGSEEVQFQSVTLVRKSSPGAAPRVYLKGCLPIGPGRDCLWDVRTLYLMKEKGILQPIWAPSPKFRLTTVCYDGRYVWAGGCEDFGSPSLIVLDPSSEKIWEVTDKDGLPILSAEERSQRKDVAQKLAAAPLEPGKICLAGCFGRSWVANVSFDAAKEKAVVKVFHEAREVPNGTYKEKWKNPAIVFDPKYIFTLTTPGGDLPEKRVLIGRRDAGNYEPSSPLIVDPQKQTVEVMRELLLEMPPMALANYQGSMYFVGPAIWNSKKKKFERRLARITFPGTTVETILPDVPPGWLVSKGDQLYLVGKEWGELNLTQRELRTMADKLPWPFDYLAPSDGRDMLEGLFPSSHYGFLAVVRRYNKNPPRLDFEILQVVVKKK